MTNANAKNTLTPCGKYCDPDCATTHLGVDFTQNDTSQARERDSNFITIVYREAFEHARALGMDHTEAHAYAADVRDVTENHLQDAIRQHEVEARLYRWSHEDPL